MKRTSGDDGGSWDNAPSSEPAGEEYLGSLSVSSITFVSFQYFLGPWTKHFQREPLSTWMQAQKSSA